MQRIEKSVLTGVVTVFDLTAEEVAANQAQASAIAQEKANRPPTLEQRVAALEEKVGK